MLILRNLLSGRMDWWIILETKNGELHDINWAGKPFVGTDNDVQHYADSLAQQAIIRGFPLKEIHIYPIKRAS